MFDQLLLKTQASLDCNMESLMSELRDQYTAAAAAAAAATTAVSQAMLIQAMSHHSRQTLQTPPGHQQPVAQLKANHTISQAQQQAKTMPVMASDLTHGSALTRNALSQSAPLDLSVKTRQQPINQTTRSRSANGAKCHLSRKQQTLDLTRIQAQLVIQVNSNGSYHRSHLDNSDNNNNNNNQLSTKLISSSMSPTSMAVDEAEESNSDDQDERLSASSTRVISSSSPSGSAGHNKRASTLATDVISSTNGRRPRRQVCIKKQKTSRSHLCNHCGRSFARSDMLTRHSRVHSGLKPFQCGECSQGFSRSDHLSTHQRTHTGEKPYQCDMCDYSACRRDMITRHMRTHSGQRVKRARARARKASNSTASTSSRISNSDINRIRTQRNKRAKFSAGHRRNSIGGLRSASRGEEDEAHDGDNVFITHHHQ